MPHEGLARHARPALGAAALAAAALALVVWAPASAQQLPDAANGQALFIAKQCAFCHRTGGASGGGPSLERVRRPQGAYELAGRLWNHAPAMFTVAGMERVEWPEATAEEMADLMAYLLADPRRDPAPDPGRGHTVLIQKACLKCHALRGEGARIAPDLALRRDALAPAPAWAAAIWRHASRMAVSALERGVMYPRFSGDEMHQLVSYLRNQGAP